MKKILINASNLHSGGGVQVASSFIYELSLLASEYKKVQISILASKKVINSLSKDVDLSNFYSFDELNVYGIRRLSKIENSLFVGYDICFTVFGPFYSKVNSLRHIVGFAQPWIAYPKNEVYERLSLFDFIKYKLKFFIQKKIFFGYDSLIVEADHVKSALQKVGFGKNIHVVSNCVSSHFNISEAVKPIYENNIEGNMVFGFLGKPYTHKNLSILPEVSKLLEENYGLNHIFLFSLTEKEMMDIGFNHINNFVSVGEITSSQCPSFYMSLDALVFPSLLECFSASPIESMSVGVPVIASERTFVSDFCGDAAIYFDPLSPKDVAEKINYFISNEEVILSAKQKGKIASSKIHSPRQRAKEYMKIILN